MALLELPQQLCVSNEVAPAGPTLAQLPASYGHAVDPQLVGQPLLGNACSFAHCLGQPEREPATMADLFNQRSHRGASLLIRHHIGTLPPSLSTEPQTSKGLRSGDRVGYTRRVSEVVRLQPLSQEMVDALMDFQKQKPAFPWVQAGLRDFPLNLFVCFGTSAEGRHVVTGLMLTPGTNTEITARALRSIPVGQLAVRAAMLQVPRVKTEVYEPPRGRPGPKGWPSEHFANVATEYRHALSKHPARPVQALRRQLHVSESTAHRWLQRCRDMGLLGPSVPGKAGEAPVARPRQEMTPEETRAALNMLADAFEPIPENDKT